jgi:hypothetical protein
MTRIRMLHIDDTAVTVWEKYLMLSSIISVSLGPYIGRYFFISPLSSFQMIYIHIVVILILNGQLGLIPLENVNCHSKGMNELLLL